MTSMIERVARILCKLEDYEPDEPMHVSYGPEDGPCWTAFIDPARTVLDELEKPTEEMIDAGLMTYGGIAGSIPIEVKKALLLDGWQAMIAKAREE